MENNNSCNSCGSSGPLHYVPFPHSTLCDNSKCYLDTVAKCEELIAQKQKATTRANE